MRAFLKILAVCTALFLTLPAGTAVADPTDISATSRSVVRIVLVARDGERTHYVGHGSGVVIAPDKILTNAHVVSIVRDDPSIVIGIIPSQGTKSYGGKIISYSPANDLAIVQMEEGSLPAATIYAMPPNDGSSVVAIGYPAAVDRAQGLQMGDMVAPMAPVKTPGVISGGRTSREMDTLLHTAPIASGNSGGPLVDTCGRVIGINSFGSLSDGNDAEFGFAVSAREILEFLRNADVPFRTTSTPCRSNADLTRDEERRQMAELQRQAELDRTANAERQLLQRNAERIADSEIGTARENRMAIAALLLGLSVFSGVVGFVMLDRGRRNPGIAGVGAGAALLIGAMIVFITRPGLADREDRIAEIIEETAPSVEIGSASFEGTNICTLNERRSRITVSELPQIELKWSNGGCINGRTQYGREGARWSRIFVPNSEQTVSINSFDPTRGEYRTERYLLGLDAMSKARTVRQRYNAKSCTADPALLAELEDMQKALRQTLPAQPNEVLVYDCKPKE